MSKISLEPNSSGSGTFTLAAPNSNTNRTLTLPDASGNIIAADASTGRFDSSNMPAGSVIQVVHSENITRQSFSERVYHTILSASITPSSSSSKIILQGFCHCHHSTTNSIGLRLTRDGNFIARNGTSQVSVHSAVALVDGKTWASASLPINFVDSPSSTSSVEYSILVASWRSPLIVNGTDNNGGTFSSGDTRGTTQLTLIEVAG